ncbi:MAG: bifunctional 3-hydroxydecanoyl-ACP dehydratase/trans-2-decenoyl-ACP isomerase [Candidatus Marinimicrobia bacterium]|nr:bifunctional 3-hydroxydecanoyl-ACP dehydratase/trans-2-decenoyl-ACP isomerase [Candidatus Neomarinimicrobiota bacterium]MDD5582254.1 bifunctional 3-hydroxydecanoyl-ACP dehydratase/trans-2-decenoyl-ACP isomerase [Candidatus Neomarinimicrobiota bacterium]
MKYCDFLTRKSFEKEELLAFAHGNLIQDPPGELSRLPAPPLLMIDRVTWVERRGQRGSISAEKDVQIDDWFFQCHFIGDPVQPGILGLDAIWQLIGFYCCLNGAFGSGRALGCDGVEFNGQIRPLNRLIRYEIDIRRRSIAKETGAMIAVGNGKVYVDDEPVYTVKNAKAGVFKDIAYTNYPFRSKHAIGGLPSHEESPLDKILKYLRKNDEH